MVDDSFQREVKALRRRLATYRLALSVAVGAALGVFLFGQIRRETVEVNDLSSELARLAANPNVTDLARTFYSSDSASVHLHVMGRTQRCPLHIHPTHGEVTAIVDGTAEVSHVVPVNGELTTATGTFTSGDLIYSPPFCGHEWVNPSANSLLGNVIFAAPPFSGNLYVTDHDPRLERGGDPAFFRVGDLLTEFRQGGEQTIERPLTSLAKRVRLIATKREFTIAPANGTIAFVRSGRGALHASGRSTAIGPAFLVVLRNHAAATIVPVGDQPMLLLIFDAD